MHHISIIGAGYVGLVTGTCLASLGLHVICYDTDVEKIDTLARGDLPIYEPDLQYLVANCIKNERLEFTHDLKMAVECSEIIFITVNTPTLDNYECDLTHVYEAVRGIAEHINGYKLIVSKSTVPVGTGKKIEQLLREILNASGNRISFDVVSNPEFLKEGSAVYDFINADRIVIGAENEFAANVMKEVYSDQILCGVTVLVTSLETAEMIKYAANSFLAAKISFINEMAAICELYDADVTQVAKGIGLDSRIGLQFLKPGLGFGGSCFSKDVRALAGISSKKGFRPVILDGILEINRQQTDRMVQKIKNAAGDLKGKNIAMLGAAFKAGTDDIRESPSLAVIKKLIENEASVSVYDPKALNTLKKWHPELKLRYCRNAYTACSKSDCIVLATEWPEFSSLDFARLKALVRKPVFLDLRNVYQPSYVKSFGFYYEGVGIK
jgi:UDPglucose 6-dehydrogenase